MKIKKLNTINITIEKFLQNPLKFLKKSKKKIVLILKNNNPIAYIFNKKKVTNIFNKIKKYQKKNCKNNFNKIMSIEKFNLKNKIEKKFSMHDNWKPDKNFIKKAAIWGIKIKKNVSKSELKSFIDYWKVEGRFLHNIQWQQKLAYSLKITRSVKPKKYIYDDNKIYKKNNFIPDGFRDK
ncbi:DnaT-like ssDNA-binding domain-containing protein [Buchnera aphidicola (Ceratovacuna keduensis)]|uniref:DnaT-like ssDNA-binding domain-containing protein n=1 Tax=Buchnera aphidicola TaxID=9 RepID=UPI0031B85E82